MKRMLIELSALTEAFLADLIQSQYLEWQVMIRTIFENNTCCYICKHVAVGHLVVKLPGGGDAEYFGAGIFAAAAGAIA